MLMTSMKLVPKQKQVLIFLSASLSALSLAVASTVECSNGPGDVHYKTYQQEGGPCCGRSSTELLFKDQSLKRVEVIHGWGRPDSKTDSDPALSIQETEQVDLHNSGVEGSKVYQNYTLNLVLQRSDGKPVLPGNPSSSAKISVVCYATHSRFPPP